jgi:predicted AAA+ superfamily ATPase
VSRKYLPRLIDALLAELFGQVPAVLLVGPRATGKTTTAARAARTVVRLDREAEAVAFRADPDSALRSMQEPLLLDEWQAVPGVLGAIKRAVDADPRPGRFLLTGSVRADLEGETWPGTGRVVRLPVYGLTERELLGRLDRPTFLDRLAESRIEAFARRGDEIDLAGYVQLALRGGFPEAALALDGRPQQLWLRSYVDQLLTRDVAGIDGGRDPERIRKYFEALALNTAGLVDDKTLFDAAGINRKTAAAYEALLQNLLVLEKQPAWTSNRLSRLVKGPKRYIVDPALACATLGLDRQAILRDGDLLGRLLDTFVMAQLRPELVLSARAPRLYHLRVEGGRHEIDCLAELFGDRVVAIEVKATAAPSRTDARHLEWLRDQLGHRFLAGAVLHTGPASFTLGDRILALPICALWG